MTDCIMPFRTLCPWQPWLFSRGIITSVVKEKVTVSALTRLEKNDALLTAVLGKIRTDPRMFYEFLSILKEDLSMKSLVESMESKT